MHEKFVIGSCPEGACLLTVDDDGKIKNTPVLNGQKFEAPPGFVHGFALPPGGRLILFAEITDFSADNITVAAI